MMMKPEVLNCIDVVRPYIHAVTAEGMPPVQLLGGVGSVALLHEATIINMDERRIIAPANLALQNYRDDGNLRDVETLVLSSNKEHAARVDKCARDTMGNYLIPETFEFGDSARIDELTAKPFGFKALKTFLSDRYMPKGYVWTPDGPEVNRSLFPFSVPIAREALETWTLEVGDDLQIPVPSPGVTVINYLTRSISGLRIKDQDKVQKMAKAIFEKAPEVVDWIVDGPGKSQFELARVFHTLREPTDDPSDLTVGEKLEIHALPYDELEEHPAFMFREARFRLQDRILRLAKIKSRGLHVAESMPFVVTLFQKYFEPRISSILHNK